MSTSTTTVGIPVENLVCRAIKNIVERGDLAEPSRINLETQSISWKPRVRSTTRLARVFLCKKGHLQSTLDALVAKGTLVKHKSKRKQDFLSFGKNVAFAARVIEVEHYTCK